MKRLILILGILAVILAAGCEKVTEYPEEPVVIPEPAPIEEIIPEEPEVVEVVIPEEPEVVEEVEEVIEEEAVSSEIVEIEIEINYKMTNNTEKDEAILDKVIAYIRNTKYTRDYPRENLWIRMYTSKDGEEGRLLWMDDVIEEEKIGYGMLVTMTGSKGGYIFKDNVVIYAEVYDSEDILLASASKTVTR